MSTALRLVNNDSIPAKKDYINHHKLSEPKTDVIFSDFIERTVERKRRRMGARYGHNYLTLVNHLKNFCEELEVTVYVNSVNEDFLDDFIIYLQERGCRQNYIRNLIELVKSMVRKAATLGYAVDPSYDDVEIEEEEPFSVFLSMNDITRIYYYQGLTRFQEKIKDLFIVGCLTALRYSDYSTLTKEEFQGDFIVKIQKKTGRKVIIPIHDYVREIHLKYGGTIPGGYTIQYFDRAVKTICKKIGFTDEVSYTYTKGNQKVTETKQKWEMISSHTARRSAATNMYLTGRMKTYEIMAFTGHTTEKSFFRYIKVTKTDTAKKLQSDTFFKK